MSDIDTAIKAKKRELKELENKKKIETLEKQLELLKSIKELPYFKGKKDSEILQEIKAKFTAQNLTNFH